jgi:1-acyl-sn-glycerol-3-phosphate acyltransferase
MKVIPWLWELSYWSCRITLLVRARVDLRFHGPVPKGPVVLCSKHATSIDIPITSYLCRAFRGDRPFFQMGSFIGYRVLGPLTFILRRIGAFSVM